MDAGTLAVVGSLGGAALSGAFAIGSHYERERLRRGGEALSRLHTATGALRLELFLETRSIARRLVHYSDKLRKGEGYPLVAERDGDPVSAYHAGGLLIYRLLRPLTIGEVIEKQTFDADLIIDPIMGDLLRFNNASVEMLTGHLLGEGLERGEDAIPGFEMERCWDPARGSQPPLEETVQEAKPPFQRIRGSYLRCAAAALLATEPATGLSRCMSHAEFCERWERPEEHRRFHADLLPAKTILHRFDPARNPHFWLRLVAYAYTCEWFYKRASADAERVNRLRRAGQLLRGRKRVKYTPIDIPVETMLELAKPPEWGGQPAEGAEFLAEHAHRYRARFDEIIATAL